MHMVALFAPARLTVSLCGPRTNFNPSLRIYDRDPTIFADDRSTNATTTIVAHGETEAATSSGGWGWGRTRARTGAWGHDADPGGHASWMRNQCQRAHLFVDRPRSFFAVVSSEDGRRSEGRDAV